MPKVWLDESERCRRPPISTPRRKANYSAGSRRVIASPACSCNDRHFQLLNADYLHYISRLSCCLCLVRHPYQNSSSRIIWDPATIATSYSIKEFFSDYQLLAYRIFFPKNLAIIWEVSTSYWSWRVSLTFVIRNLIIFRDEARKQLGDGLALAIDYWRQFKTAEMRCCVLESYVLEFGTYQNFDMCPNVWAGERFVHWRAIRRDVWGECERWGNCEWYKLFCVIF